MERIINSNKDKQTIYEIYRACRLCGAGAGYKMPIIQSVVDLDGNGVELKQKILECLQIEVHQEDKMPPLVCELCVDKVNDFYEFLELCRQTNKHTRQRLGLPLQAVARGTGSDSGDCILGVTEPVYVHDEDDEPLTRSRSNKSKKMKNVTMKNANVQIKKDPDAPVTIKKQPELRVKLEKKSQESLMAEVSSKPHSTRHVKRAPSPSPPRGRSTRNSGNYDNISLSSFKKDGKRAPSSSPPRARCTRNSGNEDLVSLSSIKQQVKNEKLSVSKSSKESSTSKPGPASKSGHSKPGPASKTSHISKSGSTSKSEPPPKSGPVSRTGSNSKPSPISKPGPASKSLPSRPGPASKTGNLSKPGPASKTAPISKSSSSKSPPTKTSTGLKSILKRDIKKEDELPFILRGKRLRDRDTEKEEVPLKKLKVSIERSSFTKPSTMRPPTPPPAPLYTCGVCQMQIKNSQGHKSHMRSHLPNFTNPKLACNACGEWFANADETAAHHRQHRTKRKPYHCRKCDNDFKQMQEYDSHFDNDECLSDEEVEDKKCHECWLTFPTENLLDEHECQGEDARPGGKCCKCSRSYALLKNLKKHESTCTAKKKVSSGEVVIAPALQAQLLPYYVRMARCDSLLAGGKKRVYDVSEIPSDFGLDKDCIYPYRFYRSWFKSDFTVFDSMVSIKDDVKNEFLTRDFVHWDSDESDESDSETVGSAKKRQIESLTALTLKIIFSQRLVGKVPRKRRKEKLEKAFDNTEFDTDVTKDIKNIIDSFNNDSNDSMRSDSLINNLNSNKTENIFDGLSKSNNDSDDHKQQDVDLSKSREGATSNDINAMEVDEAHGINVKCKNSSPDELCVDKHKNDAAINDSYKQNVDEPMDTSLNNINSTFENEKNNLLSSSRETLENKNSNSAEQIDLMEIEKKTHNDKTVNGDANQDEVNEEIDDERLMEALNAQIGESNDPNNDQDPDDNNTSQKEKNQYDNAMKTEKDKIPDLIHKESNLKGMDLDNISDENVNLEI